MNITLYTRHQVGLYSLSHLILLGHDVEVMTDDVHLHWLAAQYGCKILDNGDWGGIGRCDLFLSIHGDKIVPMQYLSDKIAVNIHPCLDKYPGRDPISRYIKNREFFGSISSHYMTAIPDKGEVIYTSEKFFTGECRSYADFYNAAIPFYYRVISETLKRICQ